MSGMTQWAKPPECREQQVLFPLKLDDAVPTQHPVRLFDEILGRLDWSSWEAQYHPSLGQPAIHPRVLASILLYGLLHRIRSSRLLERVTQMQLDFRWLAHGHAPDHTTLSGFRRKFGNELKALFVQIGLVAREMGCLPLERLAFDGTRVRANNRRSGTRTPAELRKLRDELATKFAEWERQTAEDDRRQQQWLDETTLPTPPRELANAQRRIEQIDAVLAKLAELEAGGAKPLKRLPITDLDSRVMLNKEGGFAPNYTPTATVDVDSGMIAGCDVLNDIAEERQLLPALDEVRQDFDAEPKAVLADGLFETGPNLVELEKTEVTLYSPAPKTDPAVNAALRDDLSQPVAADKLDLLPMHTTSLKTKVQQFDKAAFVYDAAQDAYWCPNGKRLAYHHTTPAQSRQGTTAYRRRYWANTANCAACPLKSRCLQAPARQRSLSRDQYETHRERQARHMAKPESQEIYKLRRHAGETPFAWIKQRFGLRQFLVRGLERVRMEWRWAATAFNLCRLMTLLAGHRGRAGPEPQIGICSL
jgi:transposase